MLYMPKPMHPGKYDQGLRRRISGGNDGQRDTIVCGLYDLGTTTFNVAKKLFIGYYV